MIRNGIVIAICLVLAISVTGGIVYATAGDNFDWLAVTDGGLRIGASGSTPSNVPPENTLEFAGAEGEVDSILSERNMNIFSTNGSGDPQAGIQLIQAEGEDANSAMMASMLGGAAVLSLAPGEGEESEAVSGVLATPDGDVIILIGGSTE